MRKINNPRVARLLSAEQEAIKEVTQSVKFGNGQNVLLEAKECYESLSIARKKRLRNFRFAFGEDQGQWGDIMEGMNGKTEAQHISDQGKTPLQYNMIQSSMQTVLGQYASNPTEPNCVSRDIDQSELGDQMTVAIQEEYQRNQVHALDVHNMIEVLGSATCFEKLTFGENPALQATGVNVYNKTLPQMFFNRMEDVRNWDCYLIGELHDMRIADVLASFGEGDSRKWQELRAIYSNCSNETIAYQYGNLTGQRESLRDFFMPYDPKFCRVIEVWKLESQAQYKCHDTLTGEYYWTGLDQDANIKYENKQRTVQANGEGINPRLIEYKRGIHQYWYYRFMSPTGEILKEGESPYWHGSHPYVLRRFMGVNGSVFSFVESMIDAQKMLNRNLTQMDFIIGASAKGLLMIPEDCIPDGWSAKDYAEEWGKVGGYIVYKPNAKGNMPEEISSASRSVGVSEMVNLIRSMLPDLSGVHGALQGKQASSGTSGKLYQAEAEQAATNLIYTFDVYKDFRTDRDRKMMMLIQQYREDGNMPSPRSARKTVRYNAKMVRNADFILSMSENTATINYRTMMNDYLTMLWQAGAMKAKTMLSLSSLPFKEEAIQAMEADEKEMAQQQAQMPQQGQQPPQPMVQ